VAAAKSLTQRNTAGVETLSVRAMQFSESPKMCSGTAVVFSVAWRPLGVVRVNWIRILYRDVFSFQDDSRF
jgi:hypothetical protein